MRRWSGLRETRACPILGICYGMQLLARESGARLEPHLPSGRPASGPHRLPEAETHPIEVAAQSLLGAAIGAGAKIVNSLHHQAVREPGPAHRVVARAADGVIEAIEAVGEDPTRWEIGVQWHPEKREDATSEALFRAFVDAARRHAGGNEAEMLWILSLTFWGFLAVSSISLFPVAVLLFLVTVAFDKRRVAMHRFTSFWASLYTWLNPAWPVRIHGRDRLYESGPAVIVANHLSLLDILVMFRLKTHFKWVSKEENFKVPLVGWNMTLCGYIPLRRGTRRASRP